MHGANNQAFTPPPGKKRRNYLKYSKEFANFVQPIKHWRKAFNEVLTIR